MIKKALKFGILGAAMMLLSLPALAQRECNNQGLLPLMSATDSNFVLHELQCWNGPQAAFSLPKSLGLYGESITNPKFLSGYAAITSTGQTDVYTVPAGRRALFIDFTSFNFSGSSSNVVPEVKISGTYYALAALTANPNNTNSVINVSPYVAEAGETLSLSSTAQPINVWLSILEFDNSSPLLTAKLLSLINGNNVIYTVPAGKTAMTCISPANFNSGLAFSAVIRYQNSSGATRTVQEFQVPSGSSPSAANAYIASHGVTTGSFDAPQSGCFASTGDSFVISTNAATATQYAFVTLILY